METNQQPSTNCLLLNFSPFLVLIQKECPLDVFYCFSRRPMFCVAISEPVTLMAVIIIEPPEMSLSCPTECKHRIMVLLRKRLPSLCSLKGRRNATASRFIADT